MLKTAYEVRISDWSSDVGSSDLRKRGRRQFTAEGAEHLRDLDFLAVGPRQLRQAIRHFIGRWLEYACVTVEQRVIAPAGSRRTLPDAHAHGRGPDTFDAGARRPRQGFDRLLFRGQIQGTKLPHDTRQQQRYESA